MTIEIETTAHRSERGWVDQDGFTGPVQPGNGPRTDPRGDFPTGPAIGETLPDFQCLDADGNPFNLHEQRGMQPTVMLFFRSAVW